jgi:hypothetical protein
LKAGNGPFLEKMAPCVAPCVAPSPLPLKTPETEVAKGGQAIGERPGNLRGSISLLLANLAGAYLAGAYLDGANLEGAYLIFTRADDDTIWPTGFDPVVAGVTFEE